MKQALVFVIKFSFDSNLSAYKSPTFLSQTVTNHSMKLLKQYNLKTDLSKNEVIDKLNEVTQTWHKENNKTQLFEGKIKGDNFKLYPTYDLAPRDQFRPEIEFFLKQKDNYTQVNLNFRLPPLFRRFIPAAIIIYLIAQIILLCVYFWTDFKIPVVFLFAPILLTMFGYYQSKIFFNIRTKRALEYLENILELKVLK